MGKSNQNDERHVQDGSEAILKRPRVPDAVLDELLADDPTGRGLTGPDGLINELRRRLIERAASGELTSDLGYPAGGEPVEASSNRRNGVSAKTLRTVDGPLRVELPRDREGSFEPRIVAKHGRSFDGFDSQILALYAGGMTTRDIQRHLRDLYGVEVSEGLVSEATKSVDEDVRAWQARPLDEFYVAIYLDAMMVSIREAGVVRKRAVYSAIGINLDGEREPLGLWIERSEGAKFWTSVMTQLRNRGVRDVLFVCVDGLRGFPEAISQAFPEAVCQTCIVHVIRASLRFLSWKERKTAAAELRLIYAAPSRDAARVERERLEAAWADSATRTAAISVWRRNWDEITPFLDYPDEIRRMIYTTNSIENLHRQIRKTIKTRGQFPSDDAALRLIWLAVTRAQQSFRKCYNWSQARAFLMIHFADRIPTIN